MNKGNEKFRKRNKVTPVNICLGLGRDAVDNGHTERELRKRKRTAKYSSKNL